ncbi:MAG TPA: (Fe-S)-binding protein [Gemmatimonadaceae bacterium]|nr:(Fe-S)-binding protein [Gemmatimonadaceae bacterium]
MLNDLLRSVEILGGVGLVFAVFIAMAYWKLRVYEDPRIDAVAALLPGANCGACGFPGCRGFAESAVAGKVQPAQCNVITGDGAAAIATYLGVDAGQANKRVARLLCAGGTNVAVKQAEYSGLETCGAASAVAGGGKGCAWGCLGYGDCAVVCKFDAITMNSFGLPVVDPVKCTACGDCVNACPKNLFQITPLDQHLLVQCRSLIEGDDALASCAVACTACGKCVLDAAPGLVSIERGVAVVHYEQNAFADPAATSRCPTGAIVWLEGAQFRARPRTASPALTGSLRA